eukprot:4709009-Prymnesium_polylepis.1
MVSDVQKALGRATGLQRRFLVSGTLNTQPGSTTAHERARGAHQERIRSHSESKRVGRDKGASAQPHHVTVD